jgi:hypothetical protein
MTVSIIDVYRANPQLLICAAVLAVLLMADAGMITLLWIMRGK